MDSKKTGQVIAERRAELALTQKQLAEQLHISDRTVSRWERGVGFPDLSLLEPLADVLGLSVVELLRGERIAPAEQLAPESERSVREIFHTFGLRLKRFRWLLITLGILLLMAAAALLLLWLNPDRVFLHTTKTVSASEALAVYPFALITTEEYDLVRQVLRDEEIIQYLPGTVDEDHLLLLEDIHAIPDETAAQYRDQLHIEGSAIDRLEIGVIYGKIFIDYYSGDRRCILDILYNGVIRKTVCQYDENGNTVYVVENEGNAVFRLSKEYRDLLVPFTVLPKTQIIIP